MHRHRNARPPRYIALLPTGERIAPGIAEAPADAVVCYGPDEFGRCPAVLAGRERVCDEADWYLLDEIGRPSFAFESSAVPPWICPVTELDSVAAARAGGDSASVVTRAGAD